MLASTREKLQKVSTATLATALFKRGLKNQFIQGVQPLVKGKGTMVGEAFTLRYIPAREDLNPITVFKDPQHPFMIIHKYFYQELNRKLPSHQTQSR